MNKDQRGILCQIQQDGSLECGDGLNWSSHETYVDGPGCLTGKEIVDVFETSPGNYVRHPDPYMTYHGFGAYSEGIYKGCISRDQMTGLIGALIHTGEMGALVRLMLSHFMRGFIFCNNVVHNGVDVTKTKFNLFKFFFGTKGENYYKTPDITGPDVWAMFLRGFGKASILAYPLLCVLDVHMLVATWFSNRKPDTDPISYTMKLMVSLEHTPTFVSRYTFKILNRQKLINEISEYWSGWRKQPELPMLYFRRLFSIAKTLKLNMNE